MGVAVRRSDRRGARGSAMVELAILLPLLLTLLFAMLEFGIAMHRWQIVANAAREGARAAAVLGTPCDPSQVETTVANYVAAAGLGPDDVTLEYTACVARGEYVSVRVTHAFPLPLVSAFVPGLESGLPLSGRALMRAE